MNDLDLVKTDVSTGMLQAQDPKALVAGATAMATELSNVIESRELFSMITGKKFVKVEGWTTLSAMMGCVPQEVSNEQQPDGRYVAVVELVRMSDQQVISRASAECGAPGEERWENADEYAKRSMAATRATSKACRLAFSWVMVLAGYEATPAEEISGKARQNVERQGGNSQHRPDVVPFGKNKGTPWADLPDRSLGWYAENAKEASVRKAAQAEVDRRNGGAPKEGEVLSKDDTTRRLNEKELRQLRRDIEDAELRISEVVEIFKLETVEDVRFCDLAPITEWLKNPVETPPQLPAW